MKIFKKIKSAVRSITWPTPKAVVGDTTLVIVFSTVVSLMIFGLSFIVDKLIY